MKLHRYSSGWDALPTSVGTWQTTVAESMAGEPAEQV